MRVLDLFSGIGGFALGLNRAGMETVAFSEIDNFCDLVLKKNFPEIPNLGDVRLVDGPDVISRFGEIDLICGGFPCQDISIAGKKRGINGDRSGLWSEFSRIINEVRPRFAIIENVGNLRSNGLARVLKDLWQIGYDAEWHIISARSVGARHLRERIWIIAYRRELQSSNNNYNRLWRCHATEEEKQRWWSESTFMLSSVFREGSCIEPTISRKADGFSNRSHRDRVKSLANSIVPQIAELIGIQILAKEVRN